MASYAQIYRGTLFQNQNLIEMARKTLQLLITAQFSERRLR